MAEKQLLVCGFIVLGLVNLVSSGPYSIKLEYVNSISDTVKRLLHDIKRSREARKVEDMEARGSGRSLELDLKNLGRLDLQGRGNGRSLGLQGRDSDQSLDLQGRGSGRSIDLQVREHETSKAGNQNTAEQEATEKMNELYFSFAMLYKLTSGFCSFVMEGTGSDSSTYTACNIVESLHTLLDTVQVDVKHPHVQQAIGDFHKHVRRFEITTMCFLNSVIGNTDGLMISYTGADEFIEGYCGARFTGITEEYETLVQRVTEFVTGVHCDEE